MESSSKAVLDSSKNSKSLKLYEFKFLKPQRTPKAFEYEELSKNTKNSKKEESLISIQLAICHTFDVKTI